MSGMTALAIYQVRGPGTKALATAEIGETLDIIAPLGKGFPLPARSETAVLLGGGIGIGPMAFLFSSLQNPSLFLGFRSETSIPKFGPAPVVSALSNALTAASIATDDGSRGFRGTVLALADTLLGLSDSGNLRPHLYACGPAPMLAEIDRFSTRKRYAAHLSVEQWMACGVGACHGCVLPSVSGEYVRACADGPVFESGIIDWEGELHA
jgi:dihydroorotate dehydrogenase electron transfer subunit